MSGKRLLGFMALMYAASHGLSCAAQQAPIPLQPVPAPAQSAPDPKQAIPPPGQNAPLPQQPTSVPRRAPVVPQTPASAAPQASPNTQPGPSPVPQAQSAPVPPVQAGPPQASPSPVQPQRRLLPSPAPAGGMVSLNFNRADLVEIVHILAQHLKLTYTIDPEVKGTVTIHSAEPLKTEDLLPIFHQVLRMNGAVAVRAGNIYRITPIKDGKVLARPAGQSREDSFAIQIVPVRFFSVAEMKKLLTPFVMPGGELIENPRGNFLIIMDLPSNIQRLVEIADLIDVQVFAGTRMEIYQPKVASAEDLAQEMTKVMQSFASSAPQTESFTAQFIPLPRINQLLVISHSEAAWTYAKRWLDRIDVVTEGPGRRIFIYPVENGKATELADVLGQALGQPTTGRRDSGRTLQDLHRSTPGGTGQLGGSRSTTPSGTTTQQNQPFGAYAAIPVPPQPPGPTTPPSPAVTAPPGFPRPPVAPSPAAKQEEQLRIVADPATNSLIIYGTVQEFQNIKNILKELDAVPRQVLMDVLIAEVTLTDDSSFGVDYEILRKLGGVRIFNREFGSRGGILTGVLPALDTAGNTFFPTGVSGVIGTGNAIRAFINAVASDSRVKILSSPSVLATDNRPARIQVGTEEPVPTGTITQTVGTIAESTSIQYRNTGRIVTIIPQVNSQGLVNLQILAEVSTLGTDRTVGPNKFPSFLTRQAETTAVVQDGETLVIGGIITDSKTRSRSGIPYLMDLPVIGRFFSTTSDLGDRTELIMMISPHVIRNRDESRSVTEEFKNKLTAVRNEIERMRRDQEQEAQRREKLRQEQQRLMEEREKQRQKQEPEKPAGPERSSSGADRIPRGSQPRHALAPMSQEMTPAAAATMPQISPVPQTGAAAPGETQDLLPASVVRDTTVQDVKVEEPGDSAKTAGTAAPTLEASAGKREAIPIIAYAVPLKQEKNQEKNKTSRTWVLQVASFRQESDAESLAHRLAERGYPAKVTTAQVNDQTWHRVRIGRFSTREEVNDLQRKLANDEGFPETLVLVH